MLTEEKLQADTQTFVTNWNKNVSALMRDLPTHITRLLARDGEPVSLKRLAAAGGWSVEELEAELNRDFWQSVDWDEDGRLAGLALTLVPKPHKVFYDNKTFYAHCAGDALMIPMILGGPVVVESPSPASGKTIRVELTPSEVVSVNPPEAVMSKADPEGGTVTDVIAQVCANRSFFTSAEDAADWLAAHPQGEVVPVADEFKILRRAEDQLGLAPRPHCAC